MIFKVDFELSPSNLVEYDSLIKAVESYGISIDSKTLLDHKAHISGSCKLSSQSQVHLKHHAVGDSFPKKSFISRWQGLGIYIEKNDSIAPTIGEKYTYEKALTGSLLSVIKVHMVQELQNKNFSLEDAVKTANTILEKMEQK